jgi:hypothetical protein
VLFEHLAQTQVIEQSADYGVVKALLPLESSSNIKGVLLEFASLAAYCASLGITDLNSQNLMITEEGITVVDAEVVLEMSVGVAGTGLFPGFFSGPLLTSGMLVIGSFFSQGQDYIEDCLERYFEAMQRIVGAREVIINEMRQATDQKPPIPIRVLIRNTDDYVSQQSRQEIEFLPEELKQIDRGDVPYFFRYFGDDKLYYYTDEQGGFTEVNSSTDFLLKKRADFTSDLQEQFSVDRLRDKTCPLGLGEFADVFCRATGVETLKLERPGFQIDLEPDIVVVTTEHARWAIIRRRVDPRGNYVSDPRDAEFQAMREGRMPSPRAPVPLSDNLRRFEGLIFPLPNKKAKT